MSDDPEISPAQPAPEISRRDTQVPPSGSPETRSLLNLAVAAVVVATLYFAQDVLIPLILAVLLSFVLAPLVDALGRAGLPRALSVGTAVLTAFGIIALAGILIANQAAALTVDAPRYAAAIEQKLRGVQLLATARLASLTRTFDRGREAGAAAELGSSSAAGDAGASAPADGSAQPRPVPVQIVQTDSQILPVARTLLAPVLGPLETTVIVLVVAVFILMEREDIRDRFIRLAGSDDLHRTTLAMNDAAARLGRYFVSQLAVNATFGTVIGIGLWFIGIPSAALWGVLAGLLRFVPYVGPILAAIAPLGLAAAIDPGWRSAIEVAALFVVVEPATGYVVEPLLYGHSTGLAPVSVIVAAVFWTWLWGPIGLILSTPLTLCAVVLGRHVKSLEFLDVLLGDRPALTPADIFYQRILANDPDDALERAEHALESHSLPEYYDAVVLQSLKQAVRDQARGLISRERAALLSKLVVHVIDDLEDHPVSETEAGAAASQPDNRRSGAVACVAGRGPFDDAVSAMLAQLLARRGIRSQRVPHAAVARDQIPHFDLTGTAAIVLSYLDMTGASSQLKFLVKRLRQHAPHVSIVVGLWPTNEIGPEDVRRLEAIGADRYVTTLGEAVDAGAAAGSALLSSSVASDHREGGAA